MAQEITNFSRFFSLLRQLPGDVDQDDLKRSLVLQCTGNRTDSLREMKRGEYQTCCMALERMVNWREKLRRKRSLCLNLMQQLGIQTHDWNRVNAFCQDGRIAGKPFGMLNPDGLDLLANKLRAIMRKGGLRKIEDDEGKPAMTVPFETYINN